MVDRSLVSWGGNARAIANLKTGSAQKLEILKLETIERLKLFKDGSDGEKAILENASAEKAIIIAEKLDAEQVLLDSLALEKLDKYAIAKENELIKLQEW